jgi:signal transduction histidine kinase/CheY-like chemotaxis protein/HPt (histidine-containing phosphotransfer) domain-containing protein
MLLAIVGFLILGSVLLWLVVDYILLRPLNIMAKRLSSVSPDQLSAHMLDDSRSDELGVLARVFNGLMASLSASYIDLKHAKDAAEQANKAKSSFIAKVSHELRTPIHSITGMLRILLREERASGKRNYIMMARNAAYGLLETINEILDFSKAEAGKLILERVEFSLHDAVREAMQTVGPRIEEKGSLETIVEMPQGIPDKVWGDPLRLRQVLVNLLGNATKFTKQGHIGLQVAMHACNAQRVLIEMTVFDTGVGIPADRLDHIFEPFGQADESVSRLFTGTGLGLTIVKQFIEGMGGTVRVESQLGVGSRFILNIPFERAAESTPVVYKPALSSARVALLDGDSAVIERFSHDLEESGYIPEIVRCDNPLELAALAKSINQYGLIIVTSEAMKHSQVFDLVVDLRGREAVPVVSVLSPFEISVRERLLALEVPFVVTRPTSLLDVLGVVSGAVSLSSEAWEDAEDWSLQLSRPLEVLVADDAQTNRIILTELLRDAGHNVVCVENGLEMVTLVKDSLEGVPGTPVFDIVLTDVQMPLLDGLSATSQIRALERELGTKRPLPIVAVTAHAMTDETSRMRNFGVDDVVTKPLDPLRLGQVIQRLTGQQSSTPMQSQSGQSTPTTPDKNLTDTQLAELGLRMWTKLATRDDSVSELFGLSEEPSSPEDFQRVLDLGDVLERSGNSVRRTLLIFRGFLDCYREQLQKLNDAKQSKSAEELRFASHALKGLLLDIGARASGGLASSIEQLSKDGQGEEGCNLVGNLTKQALLVARLVAQIEQVATGTKVPTEGDNINQQESNESIEPE